MLNIVTWIKVILGAIAANVILEELTGTGLFARLGNWLAQFMSGFTWEVLF
jgi:hypothetical protein